MTFAANNSKKVIYLKSSKEEEFTGAINNSYGDIFYYVNEKYHREGGPAVINSDGVKEYWLHHKKLDISTDSELKDYLILRIFE